MLRIKLKKTTASNFNEITDYCNIYKTLKTLLTVGYLEVIEIAITPTV
ncbi:TPA: hypothetical protein TVK16_000368 [Streptococcus equi subsp. zooepidemicus]|nr:hypothetical protein [Streptococcus equi subsp. zooepidemicus]